MTPEAFDSFLAAFSETRAVRKRLRKAVKRQRAFSGEFQDALARARKLHAVVAEVPATLDGLVAPGVPDADPLKLLARALEDLAGALRDLRKAVRASAGVNELLSEVVEFARDHGHSVTMADAQAWLEREASQPADDESPADTPAAP